MKPVVLLVGKLRDVISKTAHDLESMPVQWLGAHNREEVIAQLEAEPRISCVIIGSGLDDRIRGELIGVIGSRQPNATIHLRDRSVGPEGLTPFVRRVVSGMFEPA